MRVSESLRELGFSRYEVACYLALLARHPTNGSQLSRLAGVPRSRVYDVLRALEKRGLVDSVGQGLYIPLPPEELVRRLRSQFESKINLLREEIEHLSFRSDHDHVWTLKGYKTVMDKAQEMIAAAHRDIYARFFPEEGRELSAALKKALDRGAEVKVIWLGAPTVCFPLQVIHPEWENLEEMIGGRSLDLVSDYQEVLSGIFEKGREDLSTINWSRNRSFILSCRDGLRHDFYHYFLYKVYERGEPLTVEEKRLYELIKKDLSDRGYLDGGPKP
jgi:sugar-specific transcriptional regulator TrmB